MDERQAKFNHAVERKNAEFKQHLNDSRPDAPLTSRQREQIREAAHEHKKFTDRQEKFRRG